MPVGYVVSDSSEASGALSTLSLAELERAYIESVQAAEATEHIGRKNRLTGRCTQIAQELKARGEAHSVLQRLGGHPDAEVRKWASGNLRWLDQPSPQSDAPREKGKFWPNVVWQCEHPPPAALPRNEIAERLRQSLPKFCDRLMELTLPAIGLWPQRRVEVGLTASRFGGMPVAPPRLAMACCLGGAASLRRSNQLRRSARLAGCRTSARRRSAGVFWRP